MIFVANQEQNESYAFKEMLLQPENSDFILAMTKEVEAHEDIIHWEIINNSEVNNEHKNRSGKLKTILSI